MAHYNHPTNEFSVPACTCAYLREGERNPHGARCDYGAWLQQQRRYVPNIDIATDTYVLNGIRHAMSCPANIDERNCVCGAAALVMRLQQRRQINEDVQKQPDDRVQQAAIDEMRKHNLAAATLEASVIKRIKDILNNEVPSGRSIAAHQDMQLARIREAVQLDKIVPHSEWQPDA